MTDPPPLAHLALLLPTMSGGGAERVAAHLLGHFAGRGVRCDLVLLEARGERLAEVPEGVRLVDLACPRARFAPPRIARYFAEARPQVALSLLCQMNWAAAAGHALCRRPPPLVWSARNDLSRFVGEFPAALRPAVRAGFRRLSRRVAHLIAVSEGAAADYAREAAIPEARITVLPNPTIEPARLPERPARRAPGPPRILAVGRLAAQKNYPLLLEAAARLAETRDFRLRILGEGPDRAALEARAARLRIAGRVAFPGFSPDPLAEMAGADLFAMSSDFEGLPNALIEAMALGLPAVATDCPTGPREILEGGRWGRLVPPGDAAALAAALAATLDDIAAGRAIDPRPRAAHYAVAPNAERYLATLAAVAASA